ncbi:hypothetical protein [Pyxidicoccus trucidator]|uniref:hypothetical protein n=1 Tax=Pyxidicoccus trucidator TaxID=2709662 RepID=UPI001F0885D3|nr:hypothetical protein [Pyxidicoccus trucidator]
MTRGPRQPPSVPSSRAQDERLGRLEAALAEGRAREDAWVEEWVRRTGRLPPRKVRRKWEKKWRKEAQRAARRAEREAQRDRARSPARGGMYATLAVTCVLMAMAQPRRLWWLVFVALVFFLLAARHLERPRRDALRDAEALGTGGHAREAGDSRTSSREAEARRTQAPGPDVAEPSTEATVDPRVAKVDALCGKLLAELRGGPAVLREVVHAPERTVEALRKGCHELAHRERELRALSTPEEARRLESEREALFTRVSTEEDAVVRERLAGALAALDEQRRQRAELATAANRLEAEHTRLYYTLEGLYAQVLRVRSADTSDEDVAGAGLRHSMEQLGAEVDAVTQALEEVHRPPDGRVRTR